MNLRNIILLILFFQSTLGLSQIRYGFKTGLNFARVDGPSEQDASGGELEKWQNVTGFHIGMTLHYKFTDNFGVRGEFLYSKKGGRYTFETATKDASFRYFNTPAGNVLTRSDNVRYLVSINNSYIDIPVMVFGRWRSFELGAGASVGLLIASNGEGSLTYSGRTTVLGNPTGELKYNLKHNYLRDKPGEADETNELVSVRLDAQTIKQPKTLGAYYEYSDGTGKLFNRTDFALLGDLKYYLSKSLYVGMRLQYGIADITNNDADFSRTLTGDANGYKLKTDKDVNYVIQASVGFSF